MKRRFLSTVFILGLILTMTGCVFLRLLEMKNQMKDLDRYGHVKGQNGLVVTFLEPVLLMRDREVSSGYRTCPELGSSINEETSTASKSEPRI